MDRVFEILNPSKISRKASVGNQFTHLSDGHSDFYLNLDPSSMKLQNMCASEALLKARFGIVSDTKSTPI